MKKAGHDMSSSQLSFPVDKVLKEGNKAAVCYFNFPRHLNPGIPANSKFNYKCIYPIRGPPSAILRLLRNRQAMSKLE